MFTLPSMTWPEILSGARSTKVLLVLNCLMLFAFSDLYAQLTTSISVSNNAPNNCTARNVLVTVSGGSGSYTYFWNSNPSSSTNLGNGPSITVSPTTATTYTSGVFDNITGQFKSTPITVAPILTGDPVNNVFVPNLFTPNGDGINDIWFVVDKNKGTGPINAYGWNLVITNNNGITVYSSSGTVSTGTVGVVGGQIQWNGRLNGTGSMVPPGPYFYGLQLFNCSNTGGRLIQGTVSIVTGSSLNTLTADQIKFYPNPANNQVTISLDDVSSNVSTTAKQTENVPSTFSDYEVKLYDKFSQIRKVGVVTNGQLQLDTSNLPDGTYFLRLNQGNKVISKQLIIKH